MCLGRPASSQREDLTGVEMNSTLMGSPHWSWHVTSILTKFFIYSPWSSFSQKPEVPWMRYKMLGLIQQNSPAATWIVLELWSWRQMNICPHCTWRTDSVPVYEVQNSSIWWPITVLVLEKDRTVLWKPNSISCMIYFSIQLHRF